MAVCYPAGEVQMSLAVVATSEGKPILPNTGRVIALVPVLTHQNHCRKEQLGSCWRTTTREEYVPDGSARSERPSARPQSTLAVRYVTPADAGRLREPHECTQDQALECQEGERQSIHTGTA